MAATSDTQSVFSRLEDYKFLEDQKFVAGWTVVQSGNTSGDQETLARKFLEAKVFYFSKVPSWWWGSAAIGMRTWMVWGFVETVSLGEYLSWLKQKRENAMNDDFRSAAEATDSSTSEKFATLKICENEVAPPSGVMCDRTEAPCNTIQPVLITNVDYSLDAAKRNDCAATANENDMQQSEPVTDLEGSPQYPLSFYDIMQKVQRGEPISGVEELNIEPTNTPLTTSCVQRVSKPWENSGQV